MFTRIIIILGLIVGIVAAVSLWQNSNETAEESDNALVVTSFYPLAYFAEHIGGDMITVEQITPAGIEPHDFEPSPQDVARVYRADMFVYQGGDFDPWAEAIHEEAESQGLRVINMTEAIDPGSDDPHLWLDPELARAQVALIRDALIAIEPEQEDAFDRRASELMDALAALDENYRTGLASCEKDAIIVSHDAFSRLADRYGFEQIEIAGISPEEEPSAQRLADVTRIAQERDITVIFFEELASPELSEVIARETGAQTMLLSPIEGLTPEDIAYGHDYLSLMQQNLDHLKIALVCGA
jgi:zinc transport system substrate-binding protein